MIILVIVVATLGVLAYMHRQKLVQKDFSVKIYDPRPELMARMVEKHTGVGVLSCRIINGRWHATCQLGEDIPVEELLKQGRRLMN